MEILQKIEELPLWFTDPSDWHIFKGTEVTVKETSTLFTAELVTTCRKWEPPKYPSTGGWLKKMRSYIHKHYSFMEKVTACG